MQIHESATIQTDSPTDSLHPEPETVLPRQPKPDPAAGVRYLRDIQSMSAYLPRSTWLWKWVHRDLTSLAPADIDRLLALLDFLEHRGDGDGCLPVESLARRYSGTPLGVRAEEVGRILRERRDRARNQALLLRASSVDSSPDTLLRAGHATGTAQEVLLRAANMEDAP
jgi:hypothetical protein